ncbi:hypothetical protein SLEP1_g42812 [Rubroshorea leprosula]|uniref:F-box domain-containing protein n=1 Tax=Rubroshorea leprosula TaxID=152421 RepID=A0AAV5LCI0_9ROSI|nr:hypothetical protein SLEP1_g42812 [Rubroshorea leprosula]
MAESGKVFRRSGMDNISSLPDELVLRIISLLPMKDAVRTSVLSTRWRYLYTFTSNIDFDLQDKVGNGLANGFDLMDFVDRLFFFRSKWPLDKFRLRCPESQDIDPLRLEGWISAVLWHGIRELDLYIDSIEFKDLRLPASLFTCKTLVVLKLEISLDSGDLNSTSEFSNSSNMDSESGQLGLQVPANVCLPSLKVLHLGYIIFSDDSRERLFSNCPVLEDLKYSFDDQKCKFIVCHPTLKRLTVVSSCFDCLGNFDIVVDAPGLDYMEFCVCDVNSCAFVNVQALAKAQINFQHNECVNYRHAAANLMSAISNIQTCCISGGTLYDLQKFSVPIPGFPNLTHLTVFHSNGSTLVDLPYLLKHCHSLETLVFEDSLNRWDPGAWFPVEESSCLSFSLKKIEILSFEGTDDELEMTEYFLRSARVLESMTIHLTAKYEEQLEITKELLVLPRTSSECIVTIF